MRRGTAYAGGLVVAALALASCASTGAAQAPVPVSSAWRPGLFAEGYGPTGLGPSPSDSTLADPDQSRLASLGIQQSDLPSTLKVSLPSDGTSLDVASLAYCNGTFASESARLARRHTIVLPQSAVPSVASEAIYYRTVQDATIALSELRTVAESCPAHRTASDGTTTLVFDKVTAPTLDATGLEPDPQRLVIATNVSSQDGKATPYLLLRVWQQRGRVLVGLLYSGATTQFTDSDRSNVHLLASSVATRLDALPESFTGSA
ncbi:MAG: hypothetical protein U0R76_12015 [Candidatus Nanopelagicales bacterium]